MGILEIRDILYMKIIREEIQTEPELINSANLYKINITEEYSENDYQDMVEELLDMLNVEVEESYVIENDGKHKKWFEDFYKNLGETRWERYANFLKQFKNFPVNVVNDMKENLFKVTDLLGNPNNDRFSRKGLIVGDVQSGKTANYIGLMNLAVDVNYKVIIVLTGTTNKLREQTQLRIEEGMGSRTKLNKTVDDLNSNFQTPTYLTNYERDFNKASRDVVQMSIESSTAPVIIVTKKNTSSLSNIYSWLEDYSKRHNKAKIDSSLLLIDDEADYASVNTKEDEDPTKINSQIRQILNLFTKSSYIGYTATPFANIFINPDNSDEMIGQDLFPSDYIYVLGESSDYVGLQNIFSDDGNDKKMLCEITSEELEMFIPLKHKKDYYFNLLPPSLIEAINLFFLANVVRDLRKDYTHHRSMLINISRFTNVHHLIRDRVLEYVDQVKPIIRLYGKDEISEALKHEEIALLKEQYEKHYSTITKEIPFSVILRNMNDAIHRIKVAVINSQAENEVDYIQNKDEGERVIIIGGFSLSRGLTLEGLIISYYYRNSQMYDSLLQMGRWFGYRKNYKDLCRIFMTPAVISDFNFIATATKELKEDLKINSHRGLTPREFGIKIRSGQVGLIITARNKMRTGKETTTFVDFNKEIVEANTFNLFNDNIERNRMLINEFVEKHKDKLTNKLHPKKENQGFKGLSKFEITEFIYNYLPGERSKFDKTLILNWLDSNKTPLLENWDVVFIEGSSSKYFEYGNIQGKANERTVYKLGDTDTYRTVKSRLGSPSDGQFGLTSGQIKRVIERSGKQGTIPQKNYFERIDDNVTRNPLMLIYSIIPKIEGRDISEFTDPIPMVSIGIPDLGRANSKSIKYTVNTIYLDILEDDYYEE